MKVLGVALVVTGRTSEKVPSGACPVQAKARPGRGVGLGGPDSAIERDIVKFFEPIGLARLHGSIGPSSHREVEIDSPYDGPGGFVEAVVVFSHLRRLRLHPPR